MTCLLETSRLHLFPTIFLIVVQLAGQSINRYRILRTELSPQQEAQIILAGGIRDGVIDWWWLVFLPLVHTRVSVAVFAKLVDCRRGEVNLARRSRKAARGF